MFDVKIVTQKQWTRMKRTQGSYFVPDSPIEVNEQTYSTYRDIRNGDAYMVKDIRTVHMGFNSNLPGKVEELIAIVEEDGVCYASWGVTGRTLHEILASNLAKSLPQYDWEIGYNYLCKATKRGTS